MYKQILQSIDDVSLWPVIAFLIFFIFFVGLLVYVMKIDKQMIDEMSQMPLQDDPSTE